MPRPLLALVGLLALLIVASPGRTESLRAFDVEIDVERHGAFTVEETIRYDFGAVGRHGIFRKIPVRYGRGHAADYSIGLDVERVDDGAGNARPYEVSRDGRNLVVRIGSKARTITGEHTYRIRYRVRRGILYFEEHDEIYWNVTGTEWPVPIERARARVRLPDGPDGPDGSDGVDMAAVRVGCFTGRQGAVERRCVARLEDRIARVETTEVLGRAEGLTLVVALAKGTLVQPSRWQRGWSRFRDWLNLLYALPLAALAIMTRLWRRWGRDPRGAHAITVRYEPPEGMTPAEMGTVLDESAHMADITSTVLDLAVRGHLRIVEHTSQRFLFLNDHDYELVRLTGGDPLRPFERELLNALFARGDRQRVSDLKNRFYRHLDPLRSELYQAVVRGRWFSTSPEGVRGRWRGLAAAIAILAAIVFGVTQSAASAIPVGLTAAIVFAFAGAMPKRTKAGRRAYEEILGFKEFLTRVDADRLERSGGRTAERFERVLPYAVVLGVADEWADAFADVYREPPSWYVGSRRGFHSRGFVSDVGRSMETMGSTMRSRPGGSGRSGFGGGGFSGGGFGGGGGGSW